MGATTSQTRGGVRAATASVFAETVGQLIANIGPTLTPAIKRYQSWGSVLIGHYQSWRAGGNCCRRPISPTENFFRGEIPA
jgi:hypothetical protein